MTLHHRTKPTTAEAWLLAGFALVTIGVTVGCEDGASSSGATSSSETIAVPADETASSEMGADAEQSSANVQPEDPGPQRTRDLTFDDLRFDIEPDDPFDRTMLTDEIEELVGQQIRIRGYILPTFQRSGIKQFVLVRDNQECCFGPGAALYDCIVVDMVEGASADFSVKPVAVEGQFSVDELIGPDGKHLAIFHLEGEEVN